MEIRNKAQNCSLLTFLMSPEIQRFNLLLPMSQVQGNDEFYQRC